MKTKVYLYFHLFIVIVSIDMLIALTLRQRCKLLRWESAINLPCGKHYVAISESININNEI